MFDSLKLLLVATYPAIVRIESVPDPCEKQLHKEQLIEAILKQLNLFMNPGRDFEEAISTC